ncbi:LamG-like jellyroll fold domain-containing protein [Mucisphaera calidilacus]|uniref:LamG-like jellyroll fold domain-containing protein n=1 Tax=Mucisphaera calidilacus TaxID=2527982 RepID=A0A518C0R0_9BACT|nr:LamG-like jellyroll fold domain-containing protein [Mucisphaera calidilacus]QDU72811.1 hypothetical protein Pan265_26850 [Mucisphaera calidilacus]
MRLVDFEVAGWGEFGGSGPVERASYAERVLSLGPAGYWRLGDDGPGVADRAGGPAGLVTGGGVTGVAGSLGCDVDGAMRFEGSGAVAVGRGVLPADGSAVTIGCRVRMTAAVKGVLVSQYEQSGGVADPQRFGLRVSAEGCVGWWKGGVMLAESAVSVSDGDWHSVVGSRSGSGDVVLWVDGEVAAGGSDGQGFQATETTLGCFPGVFSLTGALDEVFVVPDVVEAEAVRSLHAMAVGVPEVIGGAA